jgi:hypothetical protein
LSESTAIVQVVLRKVGLRDCDRSVAFFN